MTQGKDSDESQNQRRARAWSLFWWKGNLCACARVRGAFPSDPGEQRVENLVTVEATTLANERPRQTCFSSYKFSCECEFKIFLLLRDSQRNTVSLQRHTPEGFVNPTDSLLLFVASRLTPGDRCGSGKLLPAICRAARRLGATSLRPRPGSPCQAHPAASRVGVSGPPPAGQPCGHLLESQRKPLSASRVLYFFPRILKRSPPTLTLEHHSALLLRASA